MSQRIVPRRSAGLSAATVLLASLAIFGTSTAAPCPAGDENAPPPPWAVSTEVSYVVTGGNAASSAFSLGANVKRNWEKDTLLVKAFVLRSNATTITRTAVGSETDFTIVEDRTRRLVAETYQLSGQYDRWLSNTILAQAGLSWDRNRFAGVASRLVLMAGAGWAGVETKRFQVKSGAALTYTLRRYIGQGSTSFAGFRAIFSAAYKPLEKSSVATQFIFDDNLKKFADWRYDWTNSVSASVSKALALKTSLRFLYAHLPALEALPLLGPGGEETGLTVPAPLRHMDTFFTTSLVISF
jgi:putative salt-induced outer membrane protein YdiY